MIVCRKFFILRFKLLPHVANFVISIVYLISVFASPLLGLVVDKSGRNILWVMISIAVTAGAHVILAFTMLNPYVGVVSYSFNEEKSKNLFNTSIGNHGFSVFLISKWFVASGCFNYS